MSTHSISSLSLSPEQLANLETLGYKTLTPIQHECLPVILDGKDLIAQAKTGSGKTVAFGLGLLNDIQQRSLDIQAMVLCPTRELADQVASELRKLARCIPNIKLVVLCGGTPVRKQIDSLEHGAHIVVGTPGRIKDHLSRETLDLSMLKTLVLDEADRMLDMGFQDEILEIIRSTPGSRQTLLFSATYPDVIDDVCKSAMQDPIRIQVDTAHEKHVIKQHFYLTGQKYRNDALLALFEHYQPESTVVFCNTKIQCRQVVGFLLDNNIEATALHGDLEQKDRDQTLVKFINRSCPVLVATDVAARGLDIESLQAVINYELPHDAENYVHRIGRTGRAGNSGLALSLHSDAEISRVIAIENYQGVTYDSETADTLQRQPDYTLKAPMTTLLIDSGRKDKLRPGDLLGALTKDAGLAGKQIGKINIFDKVSFVAIERNGILKALKHFKNGKVKGRTLGARKLR